MGPGYNPSGEQQTKWMVQSLEFLKGEAHQLTFLAPRRCGKTAFLCKLALSDALKEFNVIFLMTGSREIREAKRMIRQFNDGKDPETLTFVNYSETQFFKHPSDRPGGSEQKYCFLADEEWQSELAGSLVKAFIHSKGDKIISIGTMEETGKPLPLLDTLCAKMKVVGL